MIATVASYKRELPHSCSCEDCSKILLKHISTMNPSYSLKKCFVLHHIIPIKEGGRNEQENLVVLCRPCHYKRHNDS